MEMKYSSFWSKLFTRGSTRSNQNKSRRLRTPTNPWSHTVRLSNDININPYFKYSRVSTNVVRHHRSTRWSVKPSIYAVSRTSNVRVLTTGKKRKHNTWHRWSKLPGVLFIYITYTIRISGILFLYSDGGFLVYIRVYSINTPITRKPLLGIRYTADIPERSQYSDAKTSGE